MKTSFMNAEYQCVWAEQSQPIWQLHISNKLDKDTGESTGAGFEPGHSLFIVVKKILMSGKSSLPETEEYFTYTTAPLSGSSLNSEST